MKTYIQRVTCERPPYVLRACPKCGASEYEQSGCFRMNAQKKTVDVWLIYRCRKCKDSWNMEILSRVQPQNIPRADFLAYERNDADLARQCAFSRALLTKNKARASEEELPLTFEGEKPDPNETCVVRYELPDGFPLRLDRLLSETFSLSRSAVRKKFDTGEFSAPCGVKGRAEDGCEVVVTPGGRE